jgi:hypothetical protein
MSYIVLTPEDQVVSNDIVVSAAWPPNKYTLTSFFTASYQVTSSTGRFYSDVFESTSSTEPLFQVAWGDNTGSGSAYFNSAAPTYTPTLDIYRQYRALILGDENSRFMFDFYSGSNQIGVISVERANYKQSFNPGSLTLKLANGADVLTLTDNSQIQPTATFINNTQYYTLVSGSSGSVASSTGTPSGSYGYVFPDLGTIILNPLALQCPVVNGGLNVSWNVASPDPSNYTTLNPNPNNTTLFQIISGSGTNTGFSLQAAETISSNFIFCRVRNFENNYTSNPTIIDSTGNLIYNQLIYSPVTYITTVGLYNDNNELLAVAKLSKPLQKDFTKEALVRVKMDF